METRARGGPGEREQSGSGEGARTGDLLRKGKHWGLEVAGSRKGSGVEPAIEPEAELVMTGPMIGPDADAGVWAGEDRDADKDADAGEAAGVNAGAAAGGGGGVGGGDRSTKCLHLVLGEPWGSPMLDN